MWIIISFWQVLKWHKLVKPNHFWKRYIGRFWYFNVSVWSGDKTSHLSWLCQISILAPYCRDREPRYTQNATERLLFPWIPPRTPPNIPQTPPRQLQGTQHANRQQQTPTDTTRHSQTAPVTDFGCLAVSVGVCWRLLASVGMLCSLGMLWGCLGDVWVLSGGIWSGIHLNQRCLDVFGGYLGSQSLQYGAKILIWQSPERWDFLWPDHTETLKYQNLPM